MSKEDSFITGLKGGLGLIMALFVAFIVLPCVTCGGFAFCGGAMQGYEDAAENAEIAENTTADDGSDNSTGETNEPDPQGKWEVRTEQADMDDSESISLSLRSENETEDWLGQHHQASLVVRCVENKTSAILVTNTQANPETGNFNKAHARIRLDDGDAERVNLSESTSGESLFFPGSTRYPKEFVGHDLMRFEFTPFQMGSQVLEFDLRGYDEVLPRVQQACNWPD